MKRYSLLLVVIGVLLSGCSQSQAGEEDSIVKEGSITITDFVNRELTFDDVPERIATLSPGDMDIIYALGGEVVGRPTSEQYVIEGTEDIQQIGTAHEINIENVAMIQPDVVIGEAAMSQKEVATVEAIGSQMLLTSANSIDDIMKQINLYGELLNKEEKAKELILSITNHIESLEENEGEKARVLLVYGAPGTYMAALPNSLSGDILKYAGGENIASDYPALDTYPQYAQLNIERIIEANPDYVLLMTHANADVVKEGFIKEMKQNPAWNKLDAVVKNKIEVLPADLFGTNPGTRVTDAIELLRDMFQNVE